MDKVVADARTLAGGFRYGQSDGLGPDQAEHGGARNANEAGGAGGELAIQHATTKFTPQQKEKIRTSALRHALMDAIKAKGSSLHRAVQLLHRWMESSHFINSAFA